MHGTVEMKNGYTILVQEILNERDHLEDNITVDPEDGVLEYGLESPDIEPGPFSGCCLYGNESLGSIETRALLYSIQDKL